MSETPSAVAYPATRRFDSRPAGVTLPDPVESFTPHFLPRPRALALAVARFACAHHDDCMTVFARTRPVSNEFSPRLVRADPTGRGARGQSWIRKIHRRRSRLRPERPV